MKQRDTNRRQWSGTIHRGIMVMALIFFTLQVSASHFEGGTIKWQQNGGNNIKFTLNTTWRYSYYTSLYGTTFTVGQLVGLAGGGGLEYIDFGDASPRVQLQAKIISIDATNDLMYTEWVGTHSYNTAGTFTVRALVTSSGAPDAARLTTLSGGNANSDYQIQTVVNVGAPFNNSPVSTFPPTIYVPLGANPATFSIAASDPDGDPITYRLSSTTESGLFVAAPPNFNLNSNGTFTINTTSGYSLGQIYAVQVMMEDRSGSTTGPVKSKVPVDFLIQIVQSSVPPTFTAPTTSSFTFPIGVASSFTVSAMTTDPARIVTLEEVARPSGSAMSPGLPVSGSVGGAVSSSFGWTPTSAQPGTYVITFVAKNDLGLQSLRSVTITVPCALDATASITDNRCFGQSNGAIDLTPQNFATPANLSYEWTKSPGPTIIATTQDISGLSAGTYNVRIRDNNTACIVIKSFTVNEPTALEFTTTTTATSCPGINDGSITVFASGGTTGTTGYAYVLNSGASQSGNSFTNLFASTYTVTVKDANGCATSHAVTVSSTPDATPPSIACPGNIVVANDPGQCGAVVNLTPPTATDNCGTCPHGAAISGYTYKGNYNGHDYYLSNSSATWSAASNAAAALGGHLAAINDAGENAFVSTAAGSAYAWIGFTDQASEGTFVWYNGQSSSYTNWCGGEPNNSGNEDYTVINWCGGGGWNDLPASSTAAYVVEFDCPKVTGPSGPATFPTGTTTVAYTAEDASGNQASCSFTVTVNDTEPPHLAGTPYAGTTGTNACAANADIAAPFSASNAVQGYVDNCGGSVTATLTGTSVTGSDCSWTVSYTFSVKDDLGNTLANQSYSNSGSDQTPPNAVCQNVTVTLNNGTATVTPSQVNDGSTDNCGGPVSLSLSKTRFDCSNIGRNTVTLTVKDACGNTASCTAIVSVTGAVPQCSITSIPTTGTYTDGNPNHIYLGYGNGKTMLSVSASGGSSFTYSWSPAAGLSCTNCANPTFTPTAGGNYSFTVTVTNEYGCTTTCSITICVLDIRVPGQTNQVYICHAPPGNPANKQTLAVGVNAVSAHLSHHSGDRLGMCNQACGAHARMTSGSNYIVGDDVKVYPNPNNGTFTIELPYVEDRAMITVTDVAGKTIQNRIVKDGDGNKQIFNLGDVAKGIYFVEVTYGDQRFRTKLIIQ